MARRTYRYFDGEPLYPFGHGLSYTRFRYANARVSSPNVRAGGNVTLSADVTNTGARDGDEVVQLYLSEPGVAGAPIRALKGFERIALKRGETRTISFTLDPRALSIVDPLGVRKVAPGQVQVWIGGGQPVSRPGLAKPAGVAASFAISGTAKLPS
jgi:beta-glucosidase